ncbi:MAG: hypothetical protein ACJ72Z_12090 [Pyrinomonadaceae bacterium]
MAKAFFLTFTLAIAAISGFAQTPRNGINQTPCPLTGSYRINVVESDKMYSVVKDATSTVPFGDQQRFFLDLSTRLTPPDMLAIECNGNRVSVGSSRAPKITYLADGRVRQERSLRGNVVNSKVAMNRDSITFTSNGPGEDNVNVAFQSIDGGSRMGVTRRIYADQLPEPIVIRTVYDKIADQVDWTSYDTSTVARTNRDKQATSPITPASSIVGRSSRENDFAVALRQHLKTWVDATNRRDIAAQMQFYMPEMKAYYLTRNVPQSLVRAEKNRIFSGLRVVDIRAGEPEIIFQDNGRTAVMRFIKEYKLSGRTSTKSGVVVQELRWQRSGNEWRIFSERDIRVIR